MTAAVISLSGGIGSWFAARRWIDRHGPDGSTLLFADTLIEDGDLYRFLDDIAVDLGLPVTRIADGRDPWEVFRDERMIGNTRADPCSKILKRRMLRQWVANNIEGPATVIVGIDITEDHRLPAIAHGWEAAGHTVEAPLCWRPEALKDDALAALADRGIRPPALTTQGFPHNNCGGFCIKAGHAQFAALLRIHPDRYRHHETEEEATRVHIGRTDIAILRDRRGGDTKPMTMREFRERLEANPDDYDKQDWGSACNCIAPQLPFAAEVM